MAFCDIDDINFQISSWIIDFKLFVSLSFLNKKSYTLITNSLIYDELNILKKYVKTLKKINSGNIYYALGLINVLKKLEQNDEHFYSHESINYASDGGHVNILEWFKNSKFEFRYSKHAINWASENGHVNILEWFKNSKL